MNAAHALCWARAQLPAEHARDAELLLRFATKWDKAHLFAHPEAVLTADSEAAFRAAVLRRANGEPVQYIVGTQEFWGLEIHVTPAVLIPRPETEHVIEAVLTRIPREVRVRIADAGTGSGAIAIALARELPRARIFATDISAAALAIARANADRLGVSQRIQFVQCDLLPTDKAKSFDCVVSNPPYIAEKDRASLATEVRDFEPPQALFAGEDGLEIYRRLIPAAHRALKSGGWLVMEMGAGQKEAIQQMLATCIGGWDLVTVLPDLQDIPRIICARRSA